MTRNKKYFTINSKLNNIAVHVFVIALVFAVSVLVFIPCNKVYAEDNNETQTSQSEYESESSSAGTIEFQDNTISDRQYEKSVSVVGVLMWIIVFVCIFLILVYIIAESRRQKRDLRQKKLNVQPRLIITSGYQQDIDDLK